MTVFSRTATMLALLLSICGLSAAQTSLSTQPDTTQPTTAEPAASQPAEEVTTLVKGPYLQALRPDGVVICLEPSRDTAGQVTVQDADGRKVAQKPFDAEAGKVTRVPIDSLKPDRPYQYQVRLEGRDDPAFRSTFRTFPPVGHLPVEFVATGDSRSRPAVWNEVSEAIRKQGLPLVVHTGDFVAAGRVVGQWNSQFFEPARDMLASVALFPAVGNHEMGGKGPDAYTVLNGLFVLPDRKSWYSFDYGGVHITVLDSCRRDTLANEQYEWARKDLMASKAAWKIAVFHTPWFCAGNHESDVEMRHIFGPLFAEAGVDLFLVGHDHNYQKTHPIVHVLGPKSTKPYWQIVTGGAGAPLYNRSRPEVFLDRFATGNHYLKVSADKDRLLAVAYRLDGQDFDRLEIRKDEPAEGTVTFEQIELEQSLREWLLARRFDFSTGQPAAAAGAAWSNTLAVPVQLRFEMGQDRRFTLASEPAEPAVGAAASATQPASHEIRLTLKRTDPSGELRDMPTAIEVVYDAGEAGSGRIRNVRMPIVVAKAQDTQPATTQEAAQR